MLINDYHLAFVAWNLFLALLPCWAVYFLSENKKLRKNKNVFAVLFLFWLFVLPNTAYLFFMVRHLVNYCGDLDANRVCQMGSWQVMFFFVYALIGLPTFYYALSKMTALVKKDWLPLVAIPLTSIGLMLGLYDRFNSWDVLHSPFTLLETAASYLSGGFHQKDFIFFTVSLFLIYYVTDYFWKWRR